MTRETVVQCTCCSLKMRTKAFEDRVRVTCPKCSTVTIVDPATKPNMSNGLSVDEFAKLPEPILVEGEVSRPATSARTFRRYEKNAYRKANRDLIRKNRVKIVQTVAVGVLCLGLFGTLVTFAYKSLIQVSRETWAEIVPGMSSPDKMLNQYATICAKCQAECASITDKESGIKAAPQIRLMAGSLREVPGLVEEMIQLAPNKINELDPSRFTNVTNDCKLTQECVELVRGNKKVYSQELFSALQDMAAANEAAAKAIVSKWSPIETPNRSSDLLATPSTTDPVAP